MSVSSEAPQFYCLLSSLQYEKFQTKFGPRFSCQNPQKKMSHSILPFLEFLTWEK